MPAAIFSTKLGSCRIEWNDTAVTRFGLLASSTAGVSSSLPSWVEDIVTRVQRHLDADMQDFADVRFDFTLVSSFQRAIYEAALTVKAGTTRSYGWLAAAIGQPPAVSRAVGTALAQNPWPLLVPCHRFIASNGNMTGFSAPGGIQTKLRLLALEGAQLFAE